jgi:hypothetical protein
MPSRHLILLKLVLTPRNQEIRSTPVRAPNGQDEHHFPGTSEDLKEREKVLVSRIMMGAT